MHTQTNTKVWSESFCSDSKVTRELQLVQNPSTRWRYRRLCSHLLLQASGLPQWCHSGFQPTSILICCWFQSCSMRHGEAKTWEARTHAHTHTHIKASSRGVTLCGWTGIFQMRICDITRPWQHMGCPTVVSLTQTLFCWRSVQHMAYSWILGTRGGLSTLLLKE
jgi:hypothetical protein